MIDDGMFNKQTSKLTGLNNNNNNRGSRAPPRAHLDQMVDHEGADASSPPLGMDQQEGDVGLVVLHVRNHEAKAHHHLLIEDHHAEVGVLQAL